MDILTAKADYLAAHPNGDFIAWANETVYELNPGHPCGYGTVLTLFGETTADAIADVLQAVAPRIYTLFINGNVDFGTDAAQVMVDRLAGRIAIPVPTILAIRNLGRTGSLRIPGVTAESIAAAELRDTRTLPLDKLQADCVDEYNARIGHIEALRESAEPIPATIAEL